MSSPFQPRVNITIQKRVNRTTEAKLCLSTKRVNIENTIHNRLVPAIRLLPLPKTEEFAVVAAAPESVTLKAAAIIHLTLADPSNLWEIDDSGLPLQFSTNFMCKHGIKIEERRWSNIYFNYSYPSIDRGTVWFCRWEYSRNRLRHNPTVYFWNLY